MIKLGLISRSFSQTIYLGDERRIRMGEGTRLSMKFLGLRPEQKTSAYYSELATTLGSVNVTRLT